ncbi:L-lysine-aminomutase [Lentinula boryana]|uniref:L-lysine-aminomutase n=1 Tax=Lentinula boryana TaxID=40481 RepID=A0ABQ8Q6G4_9AGAR|nr:L-lysine-aminomutase [Lentinula boryana]
MASGEVVSSWIVTFMTDIRGGNDDAMRYVLSGYWIGLVLGRLLLVRVTSYIGPKLALTIYGIIAIGLLAVIQSVDNVAVNAVATAVNREPYWYKIPVWKDVTEKEFLDYNWQVANTVQGKYKLAKYLYAVLPEHILYDEDAPETSRHVQTRDMFVQDVLGGISLAPMSIRITPHVMSVIDWTKPLSDPIRRQFIPLKSSFIEDHPRLQLDSLNETGSSPTPGLVHRYHDKALFLAVSVCPVYCRFCTRSYSVGGPTEEVSKKNIFPPTRRRWEPMFKYIEETPQLSDIVVSGGDGYYIPPEHLTSITERLLAIPHIRRIRIASKGLAVCPSRILTPGDEWTQAIIKASTAARKMGKSVALHTHFNHPAEMTWITRLATQKLYEEGVTVRNQTVMLRGVNDNVTTMKALIRMLADNNIMPYYVYQGDMVSGVEELRTPLSTILEIERHIRGSIAGFATPNFVIDLPGGGGKRLAVSYDTYDRSTGVSTYVLPGRNGGKDKVYEHHDPL